MNNLFSLEHDYYQVLSKVIGRQGIYKNHKVMGGSQITGQCLTALGYEDRHIKHLLEEGDIIKIESIDESKLKSLRQIQQDIKNEEEKNNTNKKIAGNLLNLFNNNKEQIAEELHQINPFFYDSIGLFWFWNQKKKCYSKIDELEIMNALKLHAQDCNFQITNNGFWTEMLRALKLIGRSKHPKPFQKTWIQFKDTIIDYQTKESFKATPEYFNTNPIPWAISDNKETPIIDNLFTEWVGPENVKTLKESIGLAMIQDYTLHRIICLYGRGLNGKGVFQRLLVKILGKKNCCSSILIKLVRNNFESSKLYKKLVCLMGETDFSTLKDTSLIKQLTGQDLISSEFKGKDSFDYESYATFFVASNSLPITEDRTIGFYRRWLIIDFPNQFSEGKDPISDIPEREYSNICSQMLDLIPALINRGLFDNDGSIEDRKQRYEAKSNPLKLFISERFTEDVNGEIPFFEFYDAFNIFCSDMGFRELTKKKVSGLLNEMGFHTEKKDVKVGPETWKQWYHVIGLSDCSDRSDRTSTSFSVWGNEYKHKSEQSEESETNGNTLEIVEEEVK